MYKLVAFDAYGTLFDVYSMGQLADELYPGAGQAFALLWRDRQIEYTRLVTMSDPDPREANTICLSGILLRCPCVTPANA